MFSMPKRIRSRGKSRSKRIGGKWSTRFTRRLGSTYCDKARNKIGSIPNKDRTLKQKMQMAFCMGIDDAKKYYGEPNDGRKHTTTPDRVYESTKRNENYFDKDYIEEPIFPTK